MASSSISLSLLLFSLSLLHQQPLSSAVARPRTTVLQSDLISDPSKPQNDIPTPPTTFFQVTKPILLPKTKPCSNLVLQHDFGYTYGKSPVLAKYKPPTSCPSRNFAKIVLEWTATCKGRQFDRIFGVWLGGVELLRSCTAEPRATGIVWTVKKDITRYYSLLMTNQTLAVYLGNVVDSTYTGVYHVNLSMHFYPAEEKPIIPDSHISAHPWADLIIPISRNSPLNDGLWFEIENSTDVGLKQFRIPRNAYRAVLEVYVSFHENDEFWYSNLPDAYIDANNLTGSPGNGPFREVVVSLNGMVVGAIWPFTVIYTGGVNPLLWRPITGIGSFDLPSYDIEITPFLGTILDGKTHEFTFGVTNGLNVWFIDANLHIWVDDKSVKTEGKLSSLKISPLRVLLESDFMGMNGTFLTKARRSIKAIGWVKSSIGKVVTKWNQEFDYSNVMVMGNNGDSQIIDQVIHFNDSVYAQMPSSSVLSKVSSKRFSLYLDSSDVDHGDGSYMSLANVTLGLDENRVAALDSESSVSSLKNLQKGLASMIVKDNLVQSGYASTQQVYNYSDSKSCYFRNISSSNYTILYDKVATTCNKKIKSRFSFLLNKHRPFTATRASLASSPLDKVRNLKLPQFL